MRNPCLLWVEVEPSPGDDIDDAIPAGIALARRIGHRLNSKEPRP